MTMRSLRTGIAIVATAAVLLTGAWAGDACAPARAQSGRPSRRSFPDVPPPARESAEIPVGDALVVNGQPMQLSVLYTADPPAQVAEFYAAAFRARGLLPVATGDERLGHVSVFDPTDGLQRSVTALPESSGHTLVLLGVSDPRHAARLVGRAASAPYPLPQNHRAFLGYSSEDGTVRAHSGQFVTNLAAGQVADFYRERLIAQGYTERPGHSGGGLLVFGKSGTHVSIALQSLEERGGTAVFVNHTEGAP
jgi:hypothetical protein